MTNEIPDNTINGEIADKYENDDVAAPNCLICQTLIKEAEKKIQDKNSEVRRCMKGSDSEDVG